MSSRSGSSSVPHRWSWLLALLCLVQICERFASLAMLPMFVLYAHDRLAMSAPTALMVLVVLQALSYLGGLPGGRLADRRLGVRAATVLGALLLTVAQGSLALDRAWLFWPALALMVVGHSLFRPGLHVLIARATGNDERAPCLRRASSSRPRAFMTLATPRFARRGMGSLRLPRSVRTRFYLADTPPSAAERSRLRTAQRHNQASGKGTARKTCSSSPRLKSVATSVKLT